jgi:hypothetical protein
MAQERTGERGIGGLIWRGIRVLIAFAVSCLAGVLALLAIGGWQVARRLDSGPPIDPADPTYDNLLHYFDLVYGTSSFLVAVAPILSILPALLVIVVGEVLRLRSLLFYVVGGGLAVAALPLVASPAGTGFNLQALAGFATAGFAGGIVYWLLAGRRA